ncbi:MAG: DUF2752 domain-containing protein [Lachnoclostridium sp.]|jgi:hypothetical protein|nr:DUF2752 domain-containing protein [Lachnoclostridium sp.]
MLHRVLPSCSFYALTHLPCPSCGMTRSVESLFSFHIMESFLYNPVVLYVFLFYLVFMTSHTLERLNNLRKTPNPQIRGMKYHIGYVYFGVVLLFAQWIMKLILSF